MADGPTGKMNGITLSGLAMNAQNGINGLALGGLVVSTDGHINGLAASSVYIRSKGVVKGFTVTPGYLDAATLGIIEAARKSQVSGQRIKLTSNPVVK